MATLFVALSAVAVVTAGRHTVAHASDTTAGPGDATATVITGDAATNLAEEYRPLIAIQTQAQPCGPGEPYYPADVNVILDQPDVRLLAGDGTLITMAPSASDLFHAPAESNFDLPGNSQRPGCDFERRFGWRTGKAARQYARVVRDTDDPSRIIVQYWEYFVYNDWNNVHESDWEMAMLVFRASTPEAALATGPETVVLSQHYGNERRAWSAVQREGDRPVLYPAAGSHAIFFTQSLWFGMDGDAGFGCDDTRAPSTILDPKISVLPATVKVDGQFAWLGFEGRWGQRQRVSTNDSEVGPQYTRQWLRPIAYLHSGRDAAVSVPQIDFGVTHFFCAATKRGSQFLNYMLDHKLALLAIIAAFVAFLVFMVRRTKWRPAPPAPLLLRRRGGRIMAASLVLVRQHQRRFLPVSLLALAGGLLAAALQPITLNNTLLGTVLHMGARSGSTGMVTALVAGAAETIPMMVIAMVTGVHITHHLDADVGHKVVRTALKGRALLPMIVLTALMFTGIFAFVLVPAFVLAPAIGTAEGLPLGAALRRSAHISRHHRVRTFVLTTFAFTVSLLAAPLIGIVVLLLTGQAFWVMNVIAGIVNAITLPWLSVVLYLMYTDLLARQVERNAERDEWRDQLPTT
ncbi:MAG: hypothetical protein WCI22_05150 [Actinomycetota bacterium]